VSDTLIIFGGWARSPKSYENLISSAPLGWKVLVVPHQELMPVSDASKLNKNILRFLEKHNLSRINLLGHSLGGSLALEFAYANHNNVKRLFLVDSEGIFGNETIFEVGRNFFKSHLLHTSKKILENIRSIARIVRKPVMHMSLAKHAHRIDLQTEAKSIKVPTTILWGEKDRLTPLWQAQRLHRLIKESRLVVLKNMDHDWILHFPEGFWNNLSS